MPVYDCTFILNPQLDEASLESHIKNAKDLIDRNGGKLVKDNRIGMRRLAYEINKLTQGYYVSLVFDGTGELIKELERQFRLDEACLRFLTCHYTEYTRRETRAPRRSQPVAETKPPVAEEATVEVKPETPPTKKPDATEPKEL